MDPAAQDHPEHAHGVAWLTLPMILTHDCTQAAKRGKSDLWRGIREMTVTFDNDIQGMFERLMRLCDCDCTLEMFVQDWTREKLKSHLWIKENDALWQNGVWTGPIPDDIMKPVRKMSRKKKQ